MTFSLKMQEALVKGRESLRTITHYTTMEGFRSIIENDQLWVSNIRFLNDKREMEYGIKEAVTFLEEQARDTNNHGVKKKLFEAAKKRIQSKGIPSAYACCFCEQNDNLGQWRGYTAGGQGVAIEFNAQDLLRHFKDYNAGLVQVIYGQDATRKALKKRFEQFLDNKEGNKDLFRDATDQAAEALEQVIISLAPQFKHKSFEDEREWRLIVQTPPNSGTVKYRSKDNVLVPYLQLGEKGNGLPITRVRVGPGKDKEITRQSIELFLASKMEYEDVLVIKSTVPFRT